MIGLDGVRGGERGSSKNWVSQMKSDGTPSTVTARTAEGLLDHSTVAKHESNWGPLLSENQPRVWCVKFSVSALLKIYEVKILLATLLGGAGVGQGMDKRS